MVKLLQFLYRLVANIRDYRETTDGRVSFAYVFSDEQCNVSQAVWQLQEQQANEQQHIRQAVSQATAEKDKTIRLLQSALKASRHILNVLADILYKANEVFKRAIDAIIYFDTEQHQSFFARPKLPTSRT